MKKPSHATNRMKQHLAEHRADGSDARGEGLAVTIRIAPDGRVFFYDIPPGLVGVVASLRGTPHSQPAAPSHLCATASPPQATDQ
jgi:hypothetical protein